MAQKKYYKFLSSDYLDDFISGKKIRISRLRHFHVMEAFYGRCVGDIEEGVFKRSFKKPREEKNAPLLEELKKKQKINLQEDTEIGSGTIVEHIDCFTFSVSHNKPEDIDGLMQVMCFSDMHENNYDACVEILDIEKFACLLFQKGKLQDGRRVEDVFECLTGGEVQYENNEADLLDKTSFNHPFRKPPYPEFKRQQEYRFVFGMKDEIRSTIDDDYFYISIDEPNCLDGIVKEEFKNKENILRAEHRNKDKGEQEILEFLGKKLLSSKAAWNKRFEDIHDYMQDNRKAKIKEREIGKQYMPDFLRGDFKDIVQNYWKLKEIDIKKYTEKYIDNQLSSWARNMIELNTPRLEIYHFSFYFAKYCENHLDGDFYIRNISIF